MKYLSFNALQNISLVGVMLLGLSACNNDQQEYSISITNLTYNQPLSPPVAMLHKKNFSFWKMGESASEALEVMAEGGDGGNLLNLRKNNPQYQANAPLLAGSSIEFTLVAEHNNSHLSVAGMLVNTNDGFSGINGIELDEMLPGHKRVYYARVYDAGTEFNSELPGSIPGPADGGEGFNAERDDVTSVVTLHSGVVSADDQHAVSTLSEADKFDTPALRIVVTAL